MGRNSNKSHDRYQKANYDSILIKVRKEKQFPAILEKAAQLHNISRTRYIIAAIETALQRDGVTLDSLPADDDDNMKK